MGEYLFIECQYCKDEGMHNGCPVCGMKEEDDEESSFELHLELLCPICHDFGKPDGCPDCGKIDEDAVDESHGEVSKQTPFEMEAAI